MTQSLRIGTATIDITPPVGALLVGYVPRRATGLGHPLRAEALVCRQGERGWVLITGDTLGYPLEMTSEVRRRVSDRIGLPAAAVMLSATHTHSGPATILGAAEWNALDEQYLAMLPERLAALVETAWHSAAPAHFAGAWTTANELMSNRRVQTADGGWINEWDDPHGVHTGYADPSVLLVGARTGVGHLAGLLVNYGCHPVTLGSGSLDISPDYPGYLKDRLEAELPACTAHFALAGGGNIDPRVCVTIGAEYPRRMGESLAATVLDALPALASLAGGPLGAAIVPWDITRERDELSPVGCRRRLRGETFRTDVQALVAGSLLLVGVPGELFSEYNSLFRRRFPDFTTVVVSIANDFVGYLPTDDAQQQGAYEPTWAPLERLEATLQAHVAAAVEAATEHAARETSSRVAAMHRDITRGS